MHVERDDHDALFEMLAPGRIAFFLQQDDEVDYNVDGNRSNPPSRSPPGQ